MTLTQSVFFRNIFKISFSIAAFFAVERLAHLATDGFQIVRIQNPLPLSSSSSLEDKEVENILNQTFSYLDCGGQSYVFLSEDGKYVLKFFKFHHVRIPIWMNFLPLPKKMKDYRSYKIAKKAKTLNRTFSSYNLAFEHFKDKTGLVYLHLEKTHFLDRKIEIIDKIGIHHKIASDNVAFVLQKRGTLFYKQIDLFMRQGSLDKAKEALSAIIDLAIIRCERGLGDEDPNFCTNFGFIDENAAQIDVGRFYFDESEKTPEVYRPEIYRITRNLKNWIQDNHPELMQHFNEKIQEIYPL